MKFTIAAALAVVTALIEFTVVPYLKVGDAVPHPVLVFGVITAIIGGLETGLTWAFVGGLALDIVTQRPLGSTSFSLLIAVAAGYLVGSFLGRIRIAGADRRHCSREPALFDAAPSHDHRPDHRVPVVCRGRSSCRRPCTTSSSPRPSGRSRSPSRPAGATSSGSTGERQLPTPHRERDRRPIRFLAFGIVMSVFGVLAPGSPTSRSTAARSRRARRGEPHDGGSRSARHVA